MTITFDGSSDCLLNFKWQKLEAYRGMLTPAPSAFVRCFRCSARSIAWLVEWLCLALLTRLMHV